MNILIHRSIISELLQGNEQTEYLLREHDTLDVTFYVPDVWLKELSERISQIEDQIPPFIRELLLHTDLYINVISSPDYQITLRQAEEISRKPEDIPYFAVILYVRTIDRVWSNEPLPMSRSAKNLSMSIYNTNHLRTAVRKWRIFADQQVIASQPSTMAPSEKESKTSGTPSKKKTEPKETSPEEESETKGTPSEKESKQGTEEDTYTNYGKESDFHWMTDDRLKPMFYHRFLHFYGLRCLNDDNIYYLDPDPAEKKLALPKIEELKRSTPVWIMGFSDLGYEDYYEFQVYKVMLDKWDFYWQLFLHHDGEKFKSGADILEKDSYGCNYYRTIVITEEEYVPLLPPDTKHRLPEYKQGWDVFTTNTSLINTHPDDQEEVSKKKAKSYFGVDIVKLGKHFGGLKIGEKVFGIAIIRSLSKDYRKKEIVEKKIDYLKKVYDFYFDKEDSDVD